MHDIEPYHRWREYYVASEDKKSVFYGRIYDEFTFTQKIYNYFIHPQWDDFGSQTLYLKIIYVDYQEGYALIELLGEWNDALNNDIMYLKREIADTMYDEGIHKFVLFCDNVLNFHGDDDCYYEEWYDDVSDESGWITFVNLQHHVMKEMESTKLQHYVNLGDRYNDLAWRGNSPQHVYGMIQSIMDTGVKQLRY